ncbi:MAG: hypothetical protein JNK09_21380 [Prolixibacteraceae bacterium]|nr:hypothetical protein [Prolixibacteraceae bacterium]
MKEIRSSLVLALVSLGIFTLVFISLLVGPKGLGVLTMPLLVAGFGSWLAGVIMLVIGLVRKHNEAVSKKLIVAATLLLIAFVPVSWEYLKKAGEVRTRITVRVMNHSDKVAEQIQVYGSGTIFGKADTMKIPQLRPGEDFTYWAQPVTKPHRVGHIRMDFNIGDRSYTKTIAGEFSVNPYQLQQNWEVDIDSLFQE